MKTSKTILLAAFLVGVAVAAVRQLYPLLSKKLFGSVVADHDRVIDFARCYVCDQPISTPDAGKMLICKACDKDFIGPREVDAA